MLMREAIETSLTSDQALQEPGVLSMAAYGVYGVRGLMGGWVCGYMYGLRICFCSFVP